MLRSKKRYYLKRQTPKTAQKKKERSKKLDVYYETLISKCQFDESTGKPIYNPSRMNVAHLFDKSRHKSLENNLDNHIFLSGENHNKFDNLLMRHKFEELEKQMPNAWKIACERMSKLIFLCAENTGFKMAMENYLAEKFGGNKNND